MVFDHVMLKVPDYNATKTFYEAALKPLGMKLMKEVPEVKACGFGTCFPAFWIVEDDRPVANPAHVAFAAHTRADVRRFYKAALAAGAKDNGPPGFRPQYHKYYYGAFVLDPNGYNIEAVAHMPQGLLEWLACLLEKVSDALGLGYKAKVKEE